MPDGTVDYLCERMAEWRREIVQARIKLAEPGLSLARRAELWRIVDSREWSLKTRVADFAAELERIDRQIENELRRP